MSERMKILKVIVDKLPDACVYCRFSYFWGEKGFSDFRCRLLEPYDEIPTKMDKRYEECPLEECE